MFFKYVLSLTVVLALADEKYAIGKKSLDLKIEKSIESWPENCAKANPQVDGFYIIKIPNSDLKKFYVYCEIDADGGPAWTRIQQNTDRTKTDFFRLWKAYKHGFGDIGGDHFIGLEKLYALTNSEPHQLWIHLEDHKKNKYNLKYNLFAIGSEKETYKLTVLGEYTGFLRDLLSVHIGSKFYTRDRDNQQQCAHHYKGGWWFKNCFPTFLNGNHRNKKSGIVWGNTTNTKKITHYKKSKMSIRPLHL